MAVEARLSKHKKSTLLIYAMICLGIAIWFTYDGYRNEKFITEHSENGVADSTLVFNRNAPFFLVPCAIAFGGYLFLIRNKKVVANENTVVVNKQVIDFDSIEKIDKTFFEAKGYFIITYKDPAGGEKTIKLSDSVYDDLEALLEYLVTKIS